MKKVLFVIVSLVLVASVYAASLCRYDRTTLMWTGRTRIEWGQMDYECKCLQGHRYWMSNAGCD